jgi:hypothetical protein
LRLRIRPNEAGVPTLCLPDAFATNREAASMTAFATDKGVPTTAILAYTRFRTCQICTQTVSHATVAPVSTNQVLWEGINCQTNRAKTNSPMPPIAEPAASMLAASLPRCVPCSPSFSFFCFSCFSISVALAGNIAGNAKNSPPMPGPNFLAMMPARAVISPPKRNRTAYSCHYVCPRTERSTLICIAILSRRTRARMLPQATEELSRS